VTLWWRGHDTIMAADSSPLADRRGDLGLSCLVFWRMPSNAGAALAQRAPDPTEAIHSTNR